MFGFEEFAHERCMDAVAAFFGGYAAGDGHSERKPRRPGALFSETSDFLISAERGLALAGIMRQTKVWTIRTAISAWRNLLWVNSHSRFGIPDLQVGAIRSRPL